MKKTLKKSKKVTLIVLASVLGVLLLLTAVFGIRWAVHSKTPAEGYGEYLFNGGETQFDLDLFPYLIIEEDATQLKVMQIADPQLKFGAFPSRDRKTFDLLERAITSQKPHLCVVTGDLTLSLFTYDAFKYFAEFMEDMHTPWAFVYGNHDSQFDSSKYTIYNLLKQYPNCLFARGPVDVYGESNYLVNIYKGTKSPENLAYSLVMLDSGMYPEAESVALTDWVYDWIHQDQIDWYNWAIDGLQAINPDIQSSMFFHIPIRQFADMYYADQLQKGNAIPSQIDVSTLGVASQVKGTVCESDKADTELVDAGYNVGIFYQGKDPTATTHPDIFASVQAQNSTKAIFCGHDHANTLKGYYDGIYLGYGLCSGYHTYPYFDSEWFLTKWFGLSDKVLYNADLWVDENGEKMQKGVTMIEIDLATEYGKLTVTDKQSKDL